jgi:hypothetical protein
MEFNVLGEDRVFLKGREELCLVLGQVLIWEELARYHACHQVVIITISCSLLVTMVSLPTFIQIPPKFGVIQRLCSSFFSVLLLAYHKLTFSNKSI